MRLVHSERLQCSQQDHAIEVRSLELMGEFHHGKCTHCGKEMVVPGYILPELIKLQERGCQLLKGLGA